LTPTRQAARRLKKIYHLLLYGWQGSLDDPVGEGTRQRDRIEGNGNEREKGSGRRYPLLSLSLGKKIGKDDRKTETTENHGLGIT